MALHSYHVILVIHQGYLPIVEMYLILKTEILFEIATYDLRLGLTMILREVFRTLLNNSD